MCSGGYSTTCIVSFMRRPHCSRGKETVTPRQQAGWDLETVSSDGEISQHLLKWNPDFLVVQPCPGLLSRSELHLYVTWPTHTGDWELCIHGRDNLRYHKSLHTHSCQGRSVWTTSVLCATSGTSMPVRPRRVKKALLPFETSASVY
jgi:hypothetical protein